MGQMMQLPPTVTTGHKKLELKAIQIGAILGPGGHRIKEISAITGSNIHITSQKGDPVGTVSIVGNVEKAEVVIRQVLEKQGCPLPKEDGTEFIDRELLIPAEHMGLFVGKGGENVKRIKEQVGGNVFIRVMPSETPGLDPKFRAVEIVGENRPKAKELIKARIKEVLAMVENHKQKFEQGKEKHKAGTCFNCGAEDHMWGNCPHKGKPGYNNEGGKGAMQPWKEPWQAGPARDAPPPPPLQPPSWQGDGGRPEPMQQPWSADDSAQGQWTAPPAPPLPPPDSSWSRGQDGEAWQSGDAQGGDSWQAGDDWSSWDASWGGKKGYGKKGCGAPDMQSKGMKGCDFGMPDLPGKGAKGGDKGSLDFSHLPAAFKGGIRPKSWAAPGQMNDSFGQKGGSPPGPDSNMGDSSWGSDGDSGWPSFDSMVSSMDAPPGVLPPGPLQPPSKGTWQADTEAQMNERQQRFQQMRQAKAGANATPAAPAAPAAPSSSEASFSSTQAPDMSFGTAPMFEEGRPSVIPPKSGMVIPPKSGMMVPPKAPAPGFGGPSFGSSMSSSSMPSMPSFGSSMPAPAPPAPPPLGDSCSKCGTFMADGDLFCVKCGTRAPPKSAPPVEAAASAPQCTNCGRQMGLADQFCVKCGTKAGPKPLPAPEAVAPSSNCHNCGNPLADDDIFCIKCGTKRLAPPPPRPAEPEVAAVPADLDDEWGEVEEEAPKEPSEPDGPRHWADLDEEWGDLDPIANLTTAALLDAAGGPPQAAASSTTPVAPNGSAAAAEADLPLPELVVTPIELPGLATAKSSTKKAQKTGAKKAAKKIAQAAQKPREICENWEMGGCKLGDKCPFEHPKLE